ncbi:MAG: L,D-transpeptidase [Gemmatimonadaceae bacterium]
MLRTTLWLTLLVIGASGAAPSANAQRAARARAVMLADGDSIVVRWDFKLNLKLPIERPPIEFRSRADSVDWLRAKRLADSAREFRVVVSLHDRTLWVLSEDDTIRTVPVAVASGLTLDYAGRTWTFRTPRGRHRVLSKTTDPQWAPPDWMYAETAIEHGLVLKPLPKDGILLSDGRRLTVRNAVVGIMGGEPDEFHELPVDEHIVFDATVFIPPLETRNRTLSGELGKFALDLGRGYLLHGTPHLASIGTASTHGCIRLGDEDIAWLYTRIPVSTPVYIY